MDRDYVIKHDMVDRYLRGKLTPQEQEAFEAFYLDNAETLDELEAMKALQSAPMDSPRPLRGGLFAVWPTSLAIGALVVGLAVGWAMRPVESIFSDVVFHDIGAVRGATDRPQVLRVADGEAIIFRIAVGTEGDGWVVRLLPEGGDVITISDLSPDAFGDLVFVVASHRLPAGSVEVTARSGADRLEAVLVVDK